MPPLRVETISSRRATARVAPAADTKALPPFRRGRTLAGPQMYAARPGGRALQGAETSTGGHMGPPLQSGWQPAPSSASHSLGTFPPRGRLSGDRKGRPYGGYGSSSIFLVGAGPRPARQDSYRERWLGKPRRRYWTAPAAIFAPPGPSGPAGIQTDHSDFARRKRCTAYQEGVPRNGVRGKRPMGLGGA